MRGRRYRTLIRIVYAGGSLPEEEYDVLASAVRTAIGAGDVSISVSAEEYDVVSVAATIRGTNPLDAITRVDGALNHALMMTGQFEEFDVSGRMLQVGPLDSGSVD